MQVSFLMEIPRCRQHGDVIEQRIGQGDIDKHVYPAVDQSDQQQQHRRFAADGIDAHQTIQHRGSENRPVEGQQHQQALAADYIQRNLQLVEMDTAFKVINSRADVIKRLLDSAQCGAENQLPQKLEQARTAARDLLEKASEAAPDMAIFKYHLCMVLYQSGDRDAARVQLEKALAGDEPFIGRDIAEATLKELS